MPAPSRYSYSCSARLHIDSARAALGRGALHFYAAPAWRDQCKRMGRLFAGLALRSASFHRGHGHSDHAAAPDRAMDFSASAAAERHSGPATAGGAHDALGTVRTADHSATCWLDCHLGLSGAHTYIWAVQAAAPVARGSRAVRRAFFGS